MSDEVTTEAGRVQAFAESLRFYNAGYAAGQRAITDALLAWLDDGPDQGDNEFMWKSAVRLRLYWYPRSSGR